MAVAFDMTGVRVAITGAGGGIGSATARLIAEMGGELRISDLEAPEPLADFLRGRGTDAVASAVDVTDRAQVEAWAGASGPVGALIDCAAICPFDDWADEGWDDVADKVFEVNLQGPINVVRAFWPGMIEAGGGKIALVGSIAGRLGGVRAAPHYVMTKGGIHGFVRWAAKKGAPHDLLVNAVAPGPVATPMTQGEPFDPSGFPLRRMAAAEELAGPLAFLVSPAASYISGAVLDVNGALHFS